MNLLVIFNNCKSIQYIFKAIIELSKRNTIYYYFNHQTSRTLYTWNKLFNKKERDVVPNFEKILNNNNCIKIGEAITKNYNSQQNINHLLLCFNKVNKLDFCIIDDSNGYEKGYSHGYNIIYSLVKKIFNINVIGCIEGIKDYNCKRNDRSNIENTELQSISKSYKLCYDYICCFSLFQKNILKKNNELSNKILDIGIPYLDKLEKYKNIKSEDYVIFFTSCPKNINNKKWTSIGDNIIKIVIDFCKEKNMKLIIKEKPRNYFSYKHFENNNIQVNMAEGDELDSYISKCKLIISSPSTVTLRGLVLNKPTIILNDHYYGQLGFMKNFQGLTNNFSKKTIESKIKFFDENKNYIHNFLKNNLFGYPYKSTKLFCFMIENYLKTKI